MATSAAMKKLAALLPEVLCSDFPKMKRELALIRNMIDRGEHSDALKAVEAAKRRMLASIKRRDERRRNLPELSYPPDLPIIRRMDDIVQSIQNHPVVIIAGETGSGKTTQIPKFCLAAGRGVQGRIGCTQPRRIAAVTVAKRIAEELKEPVGKSVGYKIRFHETLHRDTCIKIMTDGILLAETQQDRYLNEYDTIIVDEAHERSLNIDFCLGILKTILERRRNFKLIITSATIDTEKFSAAFANAPIIEVSGRLYPVEVRYQSPTADDMDEEVSYIDLAVKAVNRLLQESRVGDILVFMPTERDIRETCEILSGNSGARATVLPLFARLSAAEQGQVFRSSENRKIIVATNVAETSITIPGIRFVVDTGLARISRYSPRSRTTSLPVLPISRSSADQRKGRCGRVANGTCIRLFTEEDYEQRELYTLPEILRANLAEVILRMMALKIGDISGFPFIDAPPPRSIQDGYDLLTELGAVALKDNTGGRKQGNRYRLTPKGSMMADIPLDPRLSAMLIEARRKGCLREMMVIASALSLSDPRERPADKEEEADRAQAVFADPASDFFTLMNIWDAWRKIAGAGASVSQIRRFCRAHFLSYRRMREWSDLQEQIGALLQEQGFELPSENGRETETPRSHSPNARYTAVHQSILSGYLANIGTKKEKNSYRAAKGREVMIFPGSSLYNKGPSWMVAAEIIETSRLFARTVAGIEPEWLETLGGDQCRRVYQDPHWERSRGEVVASEQVSLFGLIIVANRTVSYGPIQPEEASRIFIRSALVEEDLRSSFPFMEHNRRQVEAVRNMEDRIRRRELLIHPEDLFQFYQDRLEGVCDIRSLKRMIREKGGDDFLMLTMDDLLRRAPDPEELALFPEQVRIGQSRFACEYRFRPGRPDDGVTMKIPAQLSSRVSPDAIDWLVPGLLKEKITAMIKGLPKEHRRLLVPVGETVNLILREMPRGTGALPTMLSRFVRERFRLAIPASVWSEVKLPEHLEMRIALTAPSGKELLSGRDKQLLRQSLPLDLECDALSEAKRKWEQTGCIGWDFPDLPESIRLELEDGMEMILYPGLEKADASVNLRLFEHPDAAMDSHLQGTRLLFQLHFSKELKFLRRNLVLPSMVGAAATAFGGVKPLTSQLFERICDDLFARNIRSRVAFETHAETVKPSIQEAGKQLLDRVIPVLREYGETAAALSNEQNRPRSPLMEAFVNTMRRDLDRLMPENFVHLYDAQRMNHLTRYMKALAIRFRRGLANFEKERSKEAEIRPYEEQLNTLLPSISPKTSREKRQKIEDFFWLLQEFKVSVFAQELKTPVPVSAKRLETLWTEIQQMI
ncbi:MAG: ATP-dependent RNA helicase HrpA [Thermodesulfobacteriota bacterium]